MVWIYLVVLSIAMSAAAASAQGTEQPFRLGVQTHFKQGWDVGLIDTAKDLGAYAVRDEIDWDTVETTRGEFTFDVADKYMLPIIDAGLVPFIVVNESNPLYDDKNSPYTDEGREGFAAYISAILTRYGADAVAIEIGNEVNTENFTRGPFSEDRPFYFAKLVAAVDERLARDHPEAQFSCSGVNTISLGFLRAFFEHGGLQSCDAISVHPYRDNPDSLPWELQRLQALMREFGGEKPIYVTEFGNWFEDPTDAPGFMVKMVSIMAAAGVAEAHWYALLDEQWWPNMGLYEQGGDVEKPAAAAFRLLQDKLLPLGRAASRSDNSAVRLFEFGEGGRGFVAWASDAAIEVQGDATFLDMRGDEIAPTTRLSDVPIVILGDGVSVSIVETPVVADTKYQFNSAPWTYFARRPVRGLTPLETIDWNWTSYVGATDLNPLRIGDRGVVTASFNDRPYHAIERFTASEPGTYRVEGWWKASKDSEPSRLIIRHNGTILREVDRITDEAFMLGDLELDLAEGDTLDFELGPAEPGWTTSARRRIRVLHADGAR